MNPMGIPSYSCASSRPISRPSRRTLHSAHGSTDPVSRFSPPRPTTTLSTTVAARSIDPDRSAFFWVIPTPRVRTSLNCCENRPSRLSTPSRSRPEPCHPAMTMTTDAPRLRLRTGERGGRRRGTNRLLRRPEWRRPEWRRINPRNADPDSRKKERPRFGVVRHLVICTPTCTLRRRPAIADRAKSAGSTASTSLLRVRPRPPLESMARRLSSSSVRCTDTSAGNRSWAGRSGIDSAGTGGGSRATMKPFSSSSK